MPFPDFTMFLRDRNCTALLFHHPPKPSDFLLEQHTGGCAAVWNCLYPRIRYMCYINKFNSKHSWVSPDCRFAFYVLVFVPAKNVTTWEMTFLSRTRENICTETAAVVLGVRSGPTQRNSVGPVHARNVYGAVSVYIQSFLTSAVYGGDCSVSLMTRLLHPRGYNPGSQWTGCWVDLRTSPNAMGYRRDSCRCRESNHDSSDVQIETQIIYRPFYPGSAHSRDLSSFKQSRGGVVGIQTRLRTGRSGVRITIGVKAFLQSLQSPDWLWGPSSHLFNAYRDFYRGEHSRSANCTTHLILQARSRMSGAILPRLVYTFMAWTGENCTFTFNVIGTSCSRVFLEKLIVTQLVYKIPAFYEPEVS